MHRDIDIGLARPAVADEHVLLALFALCQLCLVGVVACAFEPYFGRAAACATVVRGVLQQLREREPCEGWRGRRPGHGGARRCLQCIREIVFVGSPPINTPLAGDVTICLSSIYTAAVIISACPLSSTTIHNADSVPSPHPDGPAAVGQVHSMGDALVPYQRLSAQYPPSTSAAPVSGIEHPSLIRVSHRRWCLLPPCGSSCWVCSVWLLFRSFL